MAFSLSRGAAQREALDFLAQVAGGRHAFPRNRAGRHRRLRGVPRVATSNRLIDSRRLEITGARELIKRDGEGALFTAVTLSGLK